MTKKGRNKKERNKKRIVISCFWYTQVYIRVHVFVYTKRRKKDDTVSSYSYLQYYLQPPPLDLFFCALYARRIRILFRRIERCVAKREKRFAKHSSCARDRFLEATFSFPSPSFFSSLFYSMHFASRENSKEDRSRKRAM